MATGNHKTKYMLWGVASILLLAQTALAQCIVTLKTATKVAPGTVVTLGDIADLSGTDADGLRGIVILPAGPGTGSTASVDLHLVRQTLEKQAKVNLGRLVFSGSTCLVRVATPDAGTKASPSAPRAQVVMGETVKDRVAARIASALGADPTDLQLNYEDQQELLMMPVSGRTVAVQPTGISDKMAMAIRVYEGDMVLAQGVARVTVQVRRDVVIAKTSLVRGMQTKTEMLEADRQWLNPSAEPATVAQAVGAIVKGHVDAGRVVMAKDVEPPVIVHKGDLVSVDCIAGTVVVGATARAKENGCDGQVIEFQPMQSKKTFMARINGAGRAVLIAPGDPGATNDAAAHL